MLNKNLYSLCLIILSIGSSCERNTNKAYFTINPENRQIVVPVHLNDTLVARLVFDTGFGTFALDSSFCVNSKFNMNNPDTIRPWRSAWSSRGVPGYFYNKNQTVKIGNTGLTFPQLLISDWMGYTNSDNSDGIFGIPQQDTVHVWELNFEYNYLEIHSATGFKMPRNSILLPLEKDDQYHMFFVRIPMHIKFVNGDTLTIDRIFLIDTGMFWDMAIMHPANEMSFFDKRNDAVWMQYSEGYNRYYTVNATFSNYSADSLRIYTFNHSMYGGYLIGLNFLKRFNVFLDLKNRQIGLQPIKNFQRVVNPLYRRFHYSTVKTPGGKIIVSKVADYTDNYYKTAGLQEGDEIIAVNGLPYDNYSYALFHRDTLLNMFRNNIMGEDRHIFREDTLTYDIIRQEKLMKIVVLVDRNEEQGD
ncbi:MAG: tight junction protein ZO-3 [Tannerella sp.]|jgi:hypothetical protein|nr:tight junction protein ZO-3 [Tannerella sp.]